jgi:hypothetical protein
MKGARGGARYILHIGEEPSSWARFGLALMGPIWGHSPINYVGPIGPTILARIIHPIMAMGFPKLKCFVGYILWINYCASSDTNKNPMLVHQQVLSIGIFMKLLRSSK